MGRDLPGLRWWYSHIWIAGFFYSMYIIDRAVTGPGTVLQALLSLFPLLLVMLILSIWTGKAEGKMVFYKKQQMIRKVQEIMQGFDEKEREL